jgi:hypothetical protein
MPTRPAFHRADPFPDEAARRAITPPLIARSDRLRLRSMPQSSRGEYRRRYILVKRILRPAEAQERLGCKHSKSYDHYVGQGLIRLLRLGPISVGVLEHVLDALIDQIAAARDAAPPAKRPRGRPRKSVMADAERVTNGAKRGSR